MMKRFVASKFLGIAGLAIILLATSAFFVYAQTNISLDYSSLPFTQATNPADFISKLYIWSLGIVGTLAVVMIVYGGIKYAVSAGNVAQQSDARSIITSAIWGMVLLAGAYLILYTINPNLVNLGQNQPVLTPISTVTSHPSGVHVGSTIHTCPTGLDAAACSQESAMEQDLQNQGIGISSTGNCDDPNNKNCTSFYGFPQSGYNALIKLKGDCGCNITVTAGTETGHDEHRQGAAIVDTRFDPSLDQYVHNQIGTNSPGLNQDYQGKDGNSYRYEDSHWHVRFNSNKGQKLWG